VVEDPDLAQRGHRDRDLVEPRVVVDRVRVKEVHANVALLRLVGHVAEGLELGELFRRDCWRTGAGVHVEALGMCGRISVVRKLRIVALHQVVPDVPLPDDLRAPGTNRLDLQDPLGHEPLLGRRVGPATRGDRLLAGLRFPGEGEHVPVGKGSDVVVEDARLVAQLPLPDEVPLPVDLLDDARDAPEAEVEEIRIAGPADQVPVLEQIMVGAAELAVPRVYDAAVAPHQEDRRGENGAEEHVAVAHPWTVRDESARHRRRRRGRDLCFRCGREVEQEEESGDPPRSEHRHAQGSSSEITVRRSFSTSRTSISPVL
jgi:hypothetical protein